MRVVMVLIEVLEAGHTKVSCLGGRGGGGHDTGLHDERFHRVLSANFVYYAEIVLNLPY